MPNGIDKNWMRMCAAVNGFRARYQRWPLRVRIPEDAISPLFTHESLAKISEKLELVEDYSLFIAEDDAGNSYNYAEEGFSPKPDIFAHIWLDVVPDSEAVKAYYQPGQHAQIPAEKHQTLPIWKTILLSELVLLILVIAAYLLTSVFSFDGHCVSFEMPRVCTMGEYMGGVLVLMHFAIPMLAIQYWWISLPLLILFPLLSVKLSMPGKIFRSFP